MLEAAETFYYHPSYGTAESKLSYGFNVFLVHSKTGKGIYRDEREAK
jgi:hypothetical protein